MKNINNNVFYNLALNNAYLKKRAKDEETDEQKILSLMTMLKKIDSTVSQIGTDGLASASNGKENTFSLQDTPPSSSNSWPSPDEIAEALAAMSEMIGYLTELKEKMEKSGSGDTEKNLLSILEAQLAQFTEALKLIQSIQEFEKDASSNIQQFKNWINSMMSQFESWMNNKTPGHYIPAGPGGVPSYIPGHDDPLISDIENAIEDYVQKEFGITISLDPDATSLSDIINSAITSVTNILTNQAQTEINSVYSKIRAMNNPVLSLLVEYLSRGQKIDKNVIDNLLRALVQTLKVLAEMSKIGNGAGASDQLLLLMLNLMTSTMGNLQETIVQTSGNRANSDEQTSKAFNQAAQMAYHKATEQLQKIIAEENEQKNLGLLEDIFAGIVGAIVSVISLGSGAFLMAAITVTMTALQETGALKTLSTKIAAALEQDGMSKKDAQWLADALVVAITIAVTIGIGSVAGVTKAATTVADTTATASTSIADASAAGADQLVANTEEFESAVSNLSQQAKTSLLKKMVDLFKSIPALANLAIGTGTQAIMSTNLLGDATVAGLERGHYSQDEIQKIETIVSITASVVLMGVSMFSAAAFSEQTSTLQGVARADSATTNSTFSWLTNNMKSVQNFLQNNNWISTLTKFNTYVLGAAQVGAKVAMGISKENQAEVQIDLGKSEAIEQIMNFYQKMAGDDLENTLKSTSSLLKGHETSSSSALSEMLAFEATYAQIMSQSA